MTRQALQQAGITTGMRALDVGRGSGDRDRNVQECVMPSKAVSDHHLKSIAWGINLKAQAAGGLSYFWATYSRCTQEESCPALA